MSAPSSRPDRLAELEEERRFLLRSIDDLEREHAAGDVDDHDYHALLDGYTARAATVLRAIDDNRAALPARRPRDWRRVAIAIVVVAAIGVVAGVLVARFSGQRSAGDTITGGTSPNRVADLLTEARQLMGTDPGAASQRYLDVLEIEPDNAEALTYAGWLVGLSAGTFEDVTTNPTVLATAKELLNEAIAADPTYADPYCFLGILAVRVENDLDTARERVAECKANNPPAMMLGLVDTFAASLGEPSSEAVPTTG